jgi:hypothetical protein
MNKGWKTTEFAIAAVAIVACLITMHIDYATGVAVIYILARTYTKKPSDTNHITYGK